MNSLGFILPLILVVGGIGLYLFKKLTSNKTAEVLQFNKDIVDKVNNENIQKQELQNKIDAEVKDLKDKQAEIEKQKGRELTNEELADFFNNRNNKS